MSPAVPALEWAVQRRLEDLIARLETKYGDLRGRVEVVPRPGVTEPGAARGRRGQAAGTVLRYPEDGRRPRTTRGDGSRPRR